MFTNWKGIVAFVVNYPDFCTSCLVLCAFYTVLCLNWWSWQGDKNIIKFEGDHNSPRPQFYFDSINIFFHNVLQPPEDEVGVTFFDTMYDYFGKVNWTPICLVVGFPDSSSQSLTIWLFHLQGSWTTVPEVGHADHGSSSASKGMLWEFRVSSLLNVLLLFSYWLGCSYSTSNKQHRRRH